MQAIKHATLPRTPMKKFGEANFFNRKALDTSQAVFESFVKLKRLFLAIKTANSCGNHSNLVGKDYN